MNNETQDQYYKSGQYDPDRRRILVWKEIIKFESEYISEDGAVVDLGAGYCDFINQVKAAKKYAVDPSPELSNFANPSVTKINSPASDLSQIPDNSIDIVHTSNLFEHFDDQELGKVMGEVKRVLKMGGKLILMQPNFSLQPARYFDDHTHKKIFNDVSLESFLISHGFKIILKKPRFLPQEMKDSSYLIPYFILPLLVRLYIHSPIKPLAGQMLMISEKV